MPQPNSNGPVSWKILATIFGGLLLALATWAAKGVQNEVGLNSNSIVELDKRLALVEQSHRDLLTGQDEILREVRKVLDEH